MANSSVVIKLKKNVIDAMCQDSDISSFIDSDEYSGSELENTHIFTYNKNPKMFEEPSAGGKYVYRGIPGTG